MPGVIDWSLIRAIAGERSRAGPLAQEGQMIETKKPFACICYLRYAIAGCSEPALTQR